MSQIQGARNVDVVVDHAAKKAVITIDLDVEPIESTSGKSMVIASTKGNKRLIEGTKIMISLNIYEKKG